ncbi:B12-binding domain-containing radical SAM protein [Candidatus Fermentibacterales bacterium]|nr:B12-binding domain-containing radical SAM protein [Candidatus Fermentibacterales bacterium]
MRVSLVSLSRGRVLEMPPLGLLYLSASILESGLGEVALHDIPIVSDGGRTPREAALEILAADPDVICLSLCTESACYARRLLQAIRESSCSIVPAVIGGPHATCAPESCARSIGAAVVVRGPAEAVLPGLLRAVTSGSPVSGPGVTRLGKSCILDARGPGFRSARGTPLRPDRSSYDLRIYRFPFTIVTSRGCPGRCRFCATQVIHSGRYYPRSLQDVSEELADLVEEHGASGLSILDDAFTSGAERTRRMCDVLANHDLRWFCESRLDSAEESILRLMADSGCREIQFGLECFDESLSRLIGKRLPEVPVARLVEMAADLGIRVAVSLMIGLPGDTVGIVMERIRKAVELADSGAAAIEFGCLKLYPGTYMYENATRLGYLECRDWWEQDREEPLCFPSRMLSREELLGLQMYANYMVSQESSAICGATVTVEQRPES